MIVAGEASGDRLAAKLIHAMNQGSHGKLEFFGSAGPKMRAAGAEAVVRADELAVIGLVDIGRALPMFLQAKRSLIGSAVERSPSVAILVDFPEFNLKLARSLKRLGVKVVYYVSPQLWAWRKYRIRSIKKYVDLLISILPFEQDWYAGHGVDRVEYVGNPLIGEVSAAVSREMLCAELGLDAGQPIIALLPGSRRREIEYILPVMLETAAEVMRGPPTCQFLVAGVSEDKAGMIDSIVASAGMSGLEHVRVVINRTYDILGAADAAAVASGTATLEAGILGTPMVIVYKTTPLNYYLLKPLVKVPHYGLINLIAEERIAAELIQNDLRPEALAGELKRLMDPVKNANMRTALKRATERLGDDGAAARAAEAILEIIGD